MSHEIPPYNTLMSPDEKRDMPQMQIAYLKTLLHVSQYRRYRLNNKHALQQLHKTSWAPDLAKTLHVHHISPMLLTGSYSFEVDLAHDIWMFRVNNMGNSSTSDLAKPLSAKSIGISCSLLRPSLYLGYCGALFERWPLDGNGTFYPGQGENLCSDTFKTLLVVLQSDLLFAEQRSGTLSIGLSPFSRRHLPDPCLVLAPTAAKLAWAAAHPSDTTQEKRSALFWGRGVASHCARLLLHRRRRHNHCKKQLIFVLLSLL